MVSRLGVLGAWVALLGGVLLVLGDAVGSALVDVVGSVLLAGGVLVFFAVAIKRSRQDGLGLATALRQAAKDALRLAWYVFKSA